MMDILLQIRDLVSAGLFNIIVRRFFNGDS